MSALFRVLRVLTRILAFGLLVGLAGASPAGAHTDFVGSEPGDGASVDGPLTELRFTFTTEVSTVPDQTSLFDNAGAAVPIATVELDGTGTVVVVTPEEPLPGGTYGANWAARAGDSHPITGSIVFTVVAPATTSPPTTSASTTAPPDTPAGETTTVPNDAPPPTTLPSAPDSTAPPTSSVPADPAGPSEALTAALGAGGSAPTGAGALAGVGRFLTYGGLLLVIGGVVYLQEVHHGPRREIRRLAALVRLAATVTIAGTALQAVGRLVLTEFGWDAVFDPGAWADFLGSETGIGLGLRFVGALVVLATMEAAYHELDVEVRHEDREERRLHSQDDTRARVPVPSMVGAGLLAIGGAFVGHTASTSPRALVVASDLAHVVAAGVWLAGVVMLTWTLTHRHRRGELLRAAHLGTRLSGVVGISLGVVVVTGAALSWSILGGPDGLSTDFGRVLLAKLVVVGAAAAIGTYNHLRVVPLLEDADREEEGSHRLRTTALVESGCFVGVVALTAVLVASSSV